MESYSTEEQQVEAIRSWLKKNGSSLLLGAAIGLLAIAGWKYYQRWQMESATAASVAYDELVKLADNKDKRDVFRQQAEALAGEYKGTAYAQFAQLYLAREAVQDNDLARAAGYLKAVADKPEDESIGHIASLRLARVEIAQGNAEAALKRVQIDKDKAGGFAGAYARVRGDALQALGRSSEAHAAYQESKAADENSARHPLLALELDATQPQEMAPAANTTPAAPATSESAK